MKILISIIFLTFSGSVSALEDVSGSAPKGWGEDVSGEMLSVDTIDLGATRTELLDVTSGFYDEKNCLQSINMNLLNHCPKIVACSVPAASDASDSYMMESYPKDKHCFTAQEQVDQMGMKNKMTKECRYSEAESALMAAGFFFDLPDIPEEKKLLGMKYKEAVQTVRDQEKLCRVTNLPFKAISQAARENKSAIAKKVRSERRVIMKPPINPPPDDWWNEY